MRVCSYVTKELDVAAVFAAEMPLSLPPSLFRHCRTTLCQMGHGQTTSSYKRMKWRDGFCDRRYYCFEYVGRMFITLYDTAHLNMFSFQSYMNHRILHPPLSLVNGGQDRHNRDCLAATILNPFAASRDKHLPLSLRRCSSILACPRNAVWGVDGWVGAPSSYNLWHTTRLKAFAFTALASQPCLFYNRKISKKCSRPFLERSQEVLNEMKPQVQ